MHGRLGASVGTGWKRGMQIPLGALGWLRYLGYNLSCKEASCLNIAIGDAFDISQQSSTLNRCRVGFRVLYFWSKND